MTLTELLGRCNAAGIRLQPAGDGLTIDAPAGSLTPDLVAELRTHKAGLLAILRPATAAPAPEVPSPEPTAQPQAAGLDLDHDAQPEPIDFGPDGWPVGSIEPEPCPTCPALLTWQDIGGRWRCETCDSDALAQSMRWADAAARARQRTSTPR